MSAETPLPGQESAQVIRCLVCHDSSDAEWAAWFERELRSYRIPRKLVGRENRRGEVIPDSLGSAHALCCEDASEETRGLLASAECIVVICSPAATQSRGLAGAIRQFKALGRAERIIAAVVGGVPGAAAMGRPHEECFPLELRHEVGADGEILDKPAEPLAADFRVDGLHPGWFDTRAFLSALRAGGHPAESAAEMSERQAQRVHLMRLKVIAGMLAINLGELTERDKAYQLELARRRRLRLLVATLAGVCLLAGAVLGFLRLREFKSSADMAAGAELAAKSRVDSLAREQARNDAERRRQAAALAVAEDREKGMNYLAGTGGLEKDRARALQHLSAAAKSGDKLAVLWLAKALTDPPVTGDEARSGVELLLGLVDADAPESVEAARKLGLIYDEGVVVPRDKARAVKFSEIAAAKGHGPSMEQLAYMLERGHAGAARQREALDWYRKSADAGYAEGWYALHIIHQQGRPALGVRPDPRLADAYLEKAAAAGSPRALYQMAGRVADAAQGIAYLERAAAAGSLDARCALATWRLKGLRGTTVNIAEGVRQAGMALDQARTSGDAKSANTMLTVLLEANVQAECAPIHTQIRSLADAGHPQAAYLYATSAGMGSGKVTDPDLFGRYMLVAAKAGQAAAQYAYGAQAVAGHLPGVEPRVGAGWVAKAADQRHAPAVLLAASLFREGQAVPKDWVMVGKYLKLAAEMRLDVDWSRFPRRVRPEGVGPPAEPVVLPKPVARPKASQADIDAALKLARSAGKRTREELDLVMKAIPAQDPDCRGYFIDVGNMLLAAGRVNEALAYFGHAAEDITSDGAASAMFQIARYHKSRNTALYYQWALLTQALRHDAAMELQLNGLRLTDKQKSEAWDACELFLEKSALGSAAAAVGMPPPAPGKPAAGDSRSPEFDRLVAKADAIAAAAEFPEEIEEALGLYAMALEIRPSAVTVLHRAADCALGLSDDQRRLYWALRAALAEKPEGADPAVARALRASQFRCASALAEIYAGGGPGRLDEIEAAKWCMVALELAETLAKDGPATTADLQERLAQVRTLQERLKDKSPESARLRVALYKHGPGVPRR